MKGEVVEPVPCAAAFFDWERAVFCTSLRLLNLALWSVLSSWTVVLSCSAHYPVSTDTPHQFTRQGAV